MEVDFNVGRSPQSGAKRWADLIDGSIMASIQPLALGLIAAQLQRAHILFIYIQRCENSDFRKGFFDI